MSRVPNIQRIDRRRLLIGSGAAVLSGMWETPLHALMTAPFSSTVVSVDEFGARPNSGEDDTGPIQAAIDAVESRGGGTVRIAARYACGNILIRTGNISLQGPGSLVNGRVTVGAEASNIQVSDLTFLDTRGDNRSFFMDISGRNCTFTNVEMIKDPIAGGYQMYLRQPSASCHFDGLRFRGSNGVMVAGTDHSFENFDFESKRLNGSGGDDAFAIKGLEGVTDGITIRNGSVRGYAAMISIGSEIGARANDARSGAVRNVIVENVTGERCARVAFIKPGALDWDWRNGLVENVTLRDLILNDPAGDYYRSGIDIVAGRGATIRHVQASGIKINARAMDQGVAPTAAVQITMLDKGAAASIEDVELQLVFVDPEDGAPHGPGAPGYPIDHIVQVEKRNPRAGVISGVVLDVEGRGSRSAGIAVGPGLDGAVTIRRTRLTRVASDPATRAGSAGIWSDSRLNMGDVDVQPVHGSKFAGKAFPNGY